MKKITIIIEDDKKGKVIIPLTYQQVNDIYGFGFMIDQDGDFYKALTLNKKEKSFWELHQISAKCIDAFDEGKCFTFKKNKMVVSKHKYFLGGKKPKWVKMK